MEIRLMPSAFISVMQSKSIQFRNDSIHEVLSSLQIQLRTESFTESHQNE